MRCKIIFFFLFAFLISCIKEDSKVNLVVYPEYCGGCVMKNFAKINQDSLIDKFNIYIDTTDQYVLNEAKENNLIYQHIDGSDIVLRFGDYANIVLFDGRKSPVELRTIDVVKEGVHY